MANETDEIKTLRLIINEQNEEIRRLKEELDKKESPAFQPLTELEQLTTVPLMTNNEISLSNEAISRYSRQLILPEIGVKGQKKLSKTSALIVGAGGLGCPAAIYLAAAGIGRLGVVDYDDVELNNLHRQILHTEKRIGISKTASLATSCAQLNSSVQYIPYHLQLTSSNAIEIIQHYDIVIDASDNVATRYLVNDTCVIIGKPLVSGSALRFEGQLTVYNYDGGPCYRCLFPQPPLPETVTNCSDGGVLGVIPGIIGCLQALEVIKIACGLQSSLKQHLLLFDGMDCSFHKVKLRPSQKNCIACGDGSKPKLIDYEQFCGSQSNDKETHVSTLSNEHRISAAEYKTFLDQHLPHVLIDVRQPVELEICSLPKKAINIPMSDIRNAKKIKSLLSEDQDQGKLIVVVCHHGNDSQIAVKKLQEVFTNLIIKDIRGGISAWAQLVPNFPQY
ncbi:adenylyltransferase and sulfurtransferase MOCS3 [Octopus bimaculoides]|uniref:adenylyltransferase and sulfurtransferase MOCS3 n=1 Tax=Octopus bimaculoides TaxID=37653 RepID=UPI00071C2393|nr:adenylyltransferase and sulfurtransferase MOCS3 [Octopus bimaculoides]|eukprot:XP_014770747.1 PREDICTED: adenylyltransferase and sulfurtransferase MOCS3-like [Octopus bimaculoides]